MLLVRLKEEKKAAGQEGEAETLAFVDCPTVECVNKEPPAKLRELGQRWYMVWRRPSMLPSSVGGGFVSMIDVTHVWWLGLPLACGDVGQPRHLDNVRMNDRDRNVSTAPTL